MDQVKDKIFYHIGTFKEGQREVIGKKVNPFFKSFDNFGYTGAIGWNQCVELLKEYQLYARERIFEDIRLASFPSFPSRKTCLWLLRADHLMDKVTYWREELSPEKHLYKLSCTGNIHVADDAFLTPRFGFLPTYREDAVKYWSGEWVSKSCIHEEVLFQADCKDNPWLPMRPVDALASNPFHPHGVQGSVSVHIVPLFPSRLK